jgi:hypothetical protein
VQCCQIGPISTKYFVGLGGITTSSIRISVHIWHHVQQDETTGRPRWQPRFFRTRRCTDVNMMFDDCTDTVQLVASIAACGIQARHLRSPVILYINRTADGVYFLADTDLWTPQMGGRPGSHEGGGSLLPSAIHSARSLAGYSAALICLAT